MGGIFSTPDPKEALRQYQRILNRCIRELDRERTNLERQEKKVTQDIKKMAKQGQMGAVRIMAKDLVRTRNHIEKFYKMRTQLQTVSLRLQTLRSTQAMAEAMKGATKVMMRLNSQVNIPGLQKIMMEFEKQSEIMDMKEEIMSDAIDDVTEEATDAQQEEEIVSRVLDELGITLDQSLPAAPAPAPSEKLPSTADLEARLENLRKT